MTIQSVAYVIACHTGMNFYPFTTLDTEMVV